jgi:phosphoribosylaminoimidazolecarboxamide formyltransferase/IMP cyclohydrolase
VTETISEAIIEVLPIRRAVVAVADKTGVVALAQALAKAGVAIVSTGNTARALQDGDVPVTPVSDVTGFPEMLDGRVKTLHPNVHAGILADKRKPDHLDQLRARELEPFDLVVVNLYPFMETVVSGAKPAEVVEQIDIGGPAMVRAAAKNFESVAVVVRPEDYEEILAEIETTTGISRETRRRLARQAFEHVSAYDTAIAGWFGSQELATDESPGDHLPADVPSAEHLAGGSRATETDASKAELPADLTIELTRRAMLRYGENPHQRGALYAAAGEPGPLGGAEVLQGKEMSFNNWLDAEAARGTVGLFDPGTPAVVIVKHNNPCGVALAPTLAQAYGRAFAGDTVSAYGGIVAFNAEVDEAAAHAMREVFTEVVVAPSYTPEALAAFAERTNLRVLRAPLPSRTGLDVRVIDGGALVQDVDPVADPQEEMRVVTSAQPTDDQWADLLFAWTVAARVKSNAIVLASGQATVGIGAGQMNRVTSVGIASEHAGDRARGSSLASDAFFPFRDGLDRAGEAGVAAVIQPGGSVRDDEVIAAAEEHGMAMVFTGARHFRH